MSLSSLLAPLDWLDNPTPVTSPERACGCVVRICGLLRRSPTALQLVGEPQAVLRRAAPKMRLGHGHNAVGWCLECDWMVGGVPRRQQPELRPNIAGPR
jgi:hypothetical protein